MVTEKTEEQKIVELAATMEFEDTTAPELRAPEKPEVAEKPPEAEKLAEPVKAETTPAPIATPPVVAAPEIPETPKKLDITTTPEWRQAQSKYDQRIAQLERDNQERRSQALTSHVGERVSAAVEAHFRAQEQELLPTVGAEEARRLVRAPNNAQQVQNYYNAQAQLALQQLKEADNAKLLDHAGKQFAKDEFSRKYGLAEEDAETLLEARSPEGMERIASRLASKRKEERQTPRVPSVKLQPTDQTAPPKEDVWQALAAAEDKSWSDMTPAERDASRRAFSGTLPSR